MFPYVKDILQQRNIIYLITEIQKKLKYAFIFDEIVVTSSHSWFVQNSFFFLFVSFYISKIYSKKERENRERGRKEERRSADVKKIFFCKIQVLFTCVLIYCTKEYEIEFKSQ